MKKNLDTGGLLFGIGIIVLFIVLPYMLLVLRKRNLSEFGLEGFSLRKSILTGLGVSCCILPLFAAAYISCAGVLKLPLADWAEIIRRDPGWTAVLCSTGRTALFHIVFVGCTEEIFYRCYMQSNLNRIFGKRWSLFGVSFGPALFVTAVLFGIVHIVRWESPLGLLVAVPGLAFGFLREWSGGFVAPAVFHGLCNTVLFMLNGNILPAAPL